MTKYTLARPQWRKNINEPDTAVQQARDYPIEKIYKGELKKVGTVVRGLCPFHSENTPSFMVYPNNTWFCFSCGIGGDAINLYMGLNSCGFMEAVKALSI
jgi:DNA primase